MFLTLKRKTLCCCHFCLSVFNLCESHESRWMLNLDCNNLPSVCVFWLIDCSEFYFHGPLQESLVLVRPSGGPRRVLEKSSSERSLTLIYTSSLSSIIQQPVINLVQCYTCVIHSVLSTVKTLQRDRHYFFMCSGRPFLWRHTSRSNHLN